MFIKRKFQWHLNFSVYCGMALIFIPYMRQWSTAGSKSCEHQCTGKFQYSSRFRGHYDISGWNKTLIYFDTAISISQIQLSHHPCNFFINFCCNLSRSKVALILIWVTQTCVRHFAESMVGTLVGPENRHTCTISLIFYKKHYHTSNAAGSWV